MFESTMQDIVDQLGQVTYILPQIIVIAAALVAPLIYFLTKRGVIAGAVTFILLVASAAFTGVMMHTSTYGTAFGIFETT